MYRVEFDLGPLPLLDGSYTVNARIQDAGGGVVHARVEPAATFEVVNPGQTTGMVALPIAIELRPLAPGERIEATAPPTAAPVDEAQPTAVPQEPGAAPVEATPGAASDGEATATLTPEESLLG